MQSLQPPRPFCLTSTISPATLQQHYYKTQTNNFLERNGTPEWTPRVSVWKSGWLPSSKLHCRKLERHFITWKLIIFLINVNIFKGNSVIQLCQPMQTLRQRVNQDIILWSYNSEWLGILSNSLIFYCCGSITDSRKMLFMPIYSFFWPLFKIWFFYNSF